ncbi:type IV toxin-antitoxin system AbiEi family antitoxin [Vibrio campbellii]
MNDNLLEKAIEQLPRELQADISVHYTNGDPHDAVIDIRLGGELYSFYVQCKTIHRKESLSHHLIQYGAEQRLLVCNALSPFLRDYCHQYNINYIDGAGNARIIRSGVYILIQGNKLKSAQGKTPMLSIGIMKCLFALLVDENLLTRPYSEIAHQSNISLGMVSKAIHYLITNKYIPEKKENRRLLDKSSLIYQWLQSYHNVLRPKISMMRLTAQQHWDELELLPGEFWGGEVAANEMTHYLIPEHALLYTYLPLKQKIRQYRARPDDNGNLTVANPFWGESLDITPFALALLSTAELLSSHDSRNREAAEIINDRYLHLKKLPTSGV